MGNKIKLLKNNAELNLDDTQLMERFYQYLRDKKLSKRKAFSIIYYLQEHLAVFPDHIEKCSVCGNIYDSYAAGHYSELTNKFYCCESCEPPGLYEREQRHEARQAEKALKGKKEVKYEGKQ